MLTSSRGQASRARNSCSNCRQGHFRCNEGTPCVRCLQKGLDCTYSAIPLQVINWEPADASVSQESDVRREQSLRDSDGGFKGFVSENAEVESRYRVLQSGPLICEAHQRHMVTSGFDTPDTWETRPASDLDSMCLPTVRDPTEAFYMQRYCDLIGPWFDLFDTSQRHWTNAIPHLSLSSRTLFTSILASCSKQYDLVFGRTSIYTLDRYDRGLSELKRALDQPSSTGNASIFASCLLIGYYEMIDAKSADWQTHLQGTLSLRLGHGWHDESNGVMQSCFWVYCRMDLLASLARPQHTLLSPGQWVSQGSNLGPAEDTPWSLDSWCNQIVVLLAQTHNLLCDMRHMQQEYDSASRLTYQSELYCDIQKRWDTISKLIEDHEHVRPIAFRPIANLPSLDQNIPLPRTIYISPAACAASQMLNVAEFFCLLARPVPNKKEYQRRLTSAKVCSHALKLARSVVSNSITNRHRTAWVNAVQLLSSVGVVLPDRGERNALLQILADIHRETGWSVANHCQDLEETWKQNEVLSQQEQYLQILHGHDTTLQYVGKSLLRYMGC